MTHIYGRGAVRLDDGTVAWHLGDRIMINGDEVPLDNRERIWLAEPKIELAPSAAQAEVDAAREAILAYRFLTPGDAQRFLGWIPAAVAGGALEWRPHAILTGPAATGKSWLLRQVLERLIGPIMSRIADGTTAAIARITQMSSLPIAIDEAEPTGRWVIESHEDAACSVWRRRIAPAGRCGVRRGCQSGAALCGPPERDSRPGDGSCRRVTDFTDTTRPRGRQLARSRRRD